MVSSNKNGRLVVKCDDTDVLVLLIYYYATHENFNHSEIFMETGHRNMTTNKKRFIPIHVISKNIGKLACEGLPSFHSLTGCDTTSSLFKIGKKQAWEIYYKNCDSLNLHKFAKMGPEEGIQFARKFVSFLYKNKNANDLNEIRLNLTNQSKKPAQELPPTEDSFKLHVLR